MTPVAGRRVLVTGLGLVTPIGVGVTDFWSGVRRGRSAVREVTRWDPALFRSRLAAEMDDTLFDPSAYLEPRRLRRLDRYSQIAVVSARLAVADAGLSAADVAAAADTAGCFLGSALGGVAFAEAQHHAYIERGVGAVSPTLALSVFGGAGPTNVALELGLRGPSHCLANSCASGANAIGEAFHHVREGRAPFLLAGGAEAPLSPLTFGSFALIRAMSTTRDLPAERAYRPFDADRDGFVMGEGGAMLVLEDAEHARARGARVYAEVVGYGTTNDAYHMLAPREDGAEAARAIREALDDARLHPHEVGYVNAHASGTPIGDRAEAAALVRALGEEHAGHVAVGATKALYGHPLGAAGAVEAALCALALTCGFLPGTPNLERPDPRCPLGGLLGPQGVQRGVDVALSTSFGFGGINAALVFRRADDA